MRRFGSLGLMACAAAAAQVLVDAGHIAAAEQAFNRPADKTVQCEFRPVKPALDFSLRFLSGFELRVPLNQYPGPGHSWAVMLRVAPEGGTASYLANLLNLPPLQATRTVGAVSGGFVIGEGRYGVAAALADDSGRVCRAEWRIEARLEPSQQHLRLALPPSSIGDLRPHRPAAAGAPDIARLTVLMHAAPLVADHSTLSAADILMQVGALSALLDQLPAASVRVTAFNLNQQAVLIRKDSFSADDIGVVANKLDQVNLGTVPVTALRNTKGEFALLAQLLNEALKDTGEPDVVVVLGPTSRPTDRIPKVAHLLPRTQRKSRIYYVQFEAIRPPLTPGDPLPPAETLRGMDIAYGRERSRKIQPTRYEGEVSGSEDAIGRAVSHLKGRTFVIRQPTDFAKAIREMKRSRRN